MNYYFIYSLFYFIIFRFIINYFTHFLFQLCIFLQKNGKKYWLYKFVIIILMQESLLRIQEFLCSRECIFMMEEIDYPSLLHQQFINHYFGVRKLMDNERNVIIKNLHISSDRNAELLAQGFIYWMLLDGKVMERLQPYLRVLKIEMWQAIGSNFEKLLKDSSTGIKVQHQLAYPLIYQQLFTYRTLPPDLTQLLIQNISNYDFDAQVVKVGMSILLMFERLLREQRDIGENLMVIFYHFLFLKCIKLICVKNSPYYRIALTIAQMLFQRNGDECLIIASEVLLGLGQPVKESFLAEVQSRAFGRQFDWTIRCRLLLINLSSRMSGMLQYILQSKIDKSALTTYFKWMYRCEVEVYGVDGVKVMGDFCRWMVVGVENIQIRVKAICWMLRRVWGVGANQGYYWVRGLLFYDWSNESLPLNALLVTIYLLQHLLQYDPKIAEDILIYLLQHPNQGRVRSILHQAYTSQIFKLSPFQDSLILAKALKDELVNICRITLTDKQNTKLNYNPDQIDNQEEEIHYEQPLSEQLNKNEIARTGFEKVHLQVNYVNEMENELMNLCKEPDMNNFFLFMNKLWKIYIQNVKEKEITDCFIEESAKIIYLMFNFQFEDFHYRCEEDQSVVYFLLKYVVQQWRKPTHKLDVAKKIIRKLGEYFPAAQIAIWRHFLMNFKFGGVNHRDVRAWLIPKIRNNQVVWMIETMMEEVDEQLRANASPYGLRIP